MRTLQSVAVIFLCVIALSCGKSISGEFDCKKGLVGHMEFRDSKNVVLSIWGMKFPTTYRHEGDYIYIKHDKGGEFSYKVVDSSTLLGESTFVNNSKCKKVVTNK